MHTLTARVENDGEETDDSSRWEQALGKFFGEKWGVNNVIARAHVMEHILETDGEKIEIPDETLLSAYHTIKRKRRLDNYCISVGAFLLLWRARPRIFCNFLAHFIADAAMIGSVDVHGRVLGKEASV